MKNLNLYELLNKFQNLYIKKTFDIYVVIQNFNFYFYLMKMFEKIEFYK